MKRIILIIQLILLNLIVISQSSDEFLKSGIEKHNKSDLKGAIKDYNKAIKLDKNNAFAYYNKGLIELAQNDFKNALIDFNKTIELKPNYLEAYYNKATAYVNLSDYKKAIEELNYIINKNEKFPNALTLRGQLFYGTQEKEKACKDFINANELGDSLAKPYISKYCGNELQGGESLTLHWPEEENWKIENSYEDDKIMMIELLRNNEKLDNWTEIGTMTSIKGVTGVSPNYLMDLMFEQSKISAKNPKLSFIEKDEECEYPWIIFKIEAENHNSGDKGPESQLWYVVQGKTSVYTNFRAIKEKTIPLDIQNKWVSFFKKGEIVYLN